MSCELSKLYKELDKNLIDLNTAEIKRIYLDILERIDDTIDLINFLNRYFKRVSNVIDSDSRISQKAINEFWDKSKRAYEIVGSKKRSFIQAYFKYLQRSGNWEKAVQTHSKWMVRERDELSNSRVDEELDRFLFYCTISDYSNAFFILEETLKTCAYDKKDKMKFYIQPLRYKLLLGMEKGVRKDIKMVAKYYLDVSEDRLYYVELLKVLSVIEPKCALRGLMYLSGCKVSTNEKIRFDMAIVAEMIAMQIHTTFNPRTKNYLEGLITDGIEIQKSMNKRNKSIMYTEEILLWRKIYRNYREKQKNI